MNVDKNRDTSGLHLGHVENMIILNFCRNKMSKKNQKNIRNVHVNGNEMSRRIEKSQVCYYVVPFQISDEK